MNKTKSIFVSTSKKHEKSSAWMTLRAQVVQRMHEATASASSASTGAVLPTIASTISNTSPEPPTYYTTDGVELFDNEGIRWGEIINEIPVGDESALTAIQINAVLFRVDDNNFLLPTHAQFVTDVWFDNLKAEPTNHYYFFPESNVWTVMSMGSAVIVSAMYLNRDEVV